MYTLIDSLDDLAFLNEELLKKPYIGLDTEFRRTNKNNMKLGLLQVNDSEEIFLIDTVSIEDPKEHIDFLVSDSCLKILHSCKEDIEAIYSWTGKKIINIFDTQLANAFLDEDYSISYQGLVKKKLGIFLEKKETRSNWIRRPLTDMQLKYASLDVEYLIYLFLEQNCLLKKQNRLDWFQQDINQIMKLVFDETNKFSDTRSVISKSQENELLTEFNNSIESIAKREKINSTLFFSKKSQKDFLRLALFEGSDIAMQEITDWRRNLIEDVLASILK